MESNQLKENATDAQNGAVVSLKEFYGLCISNWKWIFFSAVAFTIIGVFYALQKPNLYERTASVLIKDQDSGKSVGDAAEAFSSMGLISSKTNVYNELIAFTSPAVMYEVVKRLGLDVEYTTPEKFHPKTLYGTNLPFILNFPNVKEQEAVSLKVILKPDGSMIMSDFKKYEDGKKTEIDKTINVSADAARVASPLGDILIRPNLKYFGTIRKEDMEINIFRNGMQAVCDKYQRAVTGALHDKDADVIDLKAITVSAEIDTDLLNTIIEVYNEKWIDDKNRIAVATSNFINERLKVIESELGDVDADISRYKSENLVPDIKTAADIYMKQSAESGENILELSNRLSMARYVSDYLSNPSNSNSVIPINTGIGDMKIENEISSYNSMLLDRSNLIENSSAANPVVKEYDVTLKGLRQAIASAVNSKIVALSKAIGYAKTSQNASLGKIESSPRQEKYLLSVERQQKVKESLYLYLLQKREENEITQTFTAYNTRIITPPSGPLSPVAPKRKMIILVAFVIGLAVPMIILYILLLTNTKVKTKKDLESLQIPYAGEVPITETARKKKWWQKSKDTDEELSLEIKPGLRDNINEAFKVIRNNFDFMASNKNDGGSVILVTSFNPGSGKSFFSLNLAATYALKGKKTLIIDSDLRHGSVSKYINSPIKGISNYLSGNSETWEQFVKPIADNPNLYILPIGNQPPNPLELIENGKFAELIKEAREQYDIIVLDCPPDGIVADSLSIAQFADRTVFVVRAGLFEKALLPELSKIYNEKKYPGMCVILNFVKDSTGGRYGGYHYRYGYGYRSYHSYYGGKK